MVDFDKIDPELRNIIKALNDKGYITEFSCAGNHQNVPSWERNPRGHICFVGRLDAVLLENILRGLGLKRIKIWHLKSGYTDVRFTGLGGLSVEYDMQNGWGKVLELESKGVLTSKETRLEQDCGGYGK